MSASQVGKLDELADRMGLTRSQLLRRLVDATADMKTTSKRLTEEEALDLLHEQARGGRVSAIVEVVRRYREEDPRKRAFLALERLAEERSTLSELVELAFRSLGRAANRSEIATVAKAIRESGDEEALALFQPPGGE